MRVIIILLICFPLFYTCFHSNLIFVSVPFNLFKLTVNCLHVYYPFFRACSRQYIYISAKTPTSLYLNLSNNIQRCLLHICRMFILQIPILETFSVNLRYYSSLFCDFMIKFCSFLLTCSRQAHKKKIFIWLLTLYLY